MLALSKKNPCTEIKQEHCQFLFSVVMLITVVILIIIISFMAV